MSFETYQVFTGGAFENDCRLMTRDLREKQVGPLKQAYFYFFLTAYTVFQMPFAIVCFFLLGFAFFVFFLKLVEEKEKKKH